MSELKNKYSVSEMIQLACWFFRTKIIDKRARLFRFPMIIRGRRYIDFGTSLTTGLGCRFDCFPGTDSTTKKLVFGKNVQLNDYVHIVAMSSVTIGDNVIIGANSVVTHDVAKNSVVVGIPARVIKSIK